MIGVGGPNYLGGSATLINEEDTLQCLPQLIDKKAKKHMRNTEPSF